MVGAEVAKACEVCNCLRFFSPREQKPEEVGRECEYTRSTLAKSHCHWYVITLYKGAFVYSYLWESNYQYSPQEGGLRHSNSASIVDFPCPTEHQL